MLELLGAIGGIVLVDLALSGDNALVIGAAAAGLPRRQRTQAIVLGGAGAIVLRIVFAIAATLLLQLPFLQALGGLALLYIAARLLLERTGAHEEQIDEQAMLIPHAAPAAQNADSSGFVRALMTILVADVTMSLDNVLAIGTASARHWPAAEHRAGAGGQRAGGESDPSAALAVGCGCAGARLDGGEHAAARPAAGAMAA
jgi:YjbE family integral membrane protein